MIPFASHPICKFDGKDYFKDDFTKIGQLIKKDFVDSGNVFNHTVELANNVNDSYPKINAYRDYVYIVWNIENNE